MGRLFSGGIHPAGRKELTRRKPLMELDAPPKEVVLSLDICPAPPAIPVVKAGDPVLVGQLVARPADETGVPIYASVSGRVTAVAPRPHPFTGEALAVVIQNDGKDTPVPTDPFDLRELSQEELLQRIGAAGVVGMGGDAVPVHVKLQLARGKVDTLIINAAECEPYLTADHRLLLDRGREVLTGARVLQRVLGVSRAVIASEGDKLNAIEKLERVLGKREKRVKLRTILTRYPLGAERQIVQRITGREIPPDKGSIDVGCVVFNVATAAAVGRALTTGIPLTHRAVTVTGGAVARPRNLWVPLGAPLELLLQSAGGLKEEQDVTLLGGPMMGIQIGRLDYPVLPTTKGLTCMARWERETDYPEEQCLQCGHCVAACPMHLAPAFIHRALQEGDDRKLPDYYPQDCIECGCCAYSCPCHIRLVDSLRAAKIRLQRIQAEGRAD